MQEAGSNHKETNCLFFVADYFIAVNLFNNYDFRILFLDTCM